MIYCSDLGYEKTAVSNFQLLPGIVQRIGSCNRQLPSEPSLSKIESYAFIEGTFAERSLVL
ncbi:MAG: hypothetical protein K1X29_05095 [Bdellovibrionales bacterium]|nr:hypothetical protein [Bdellovibrionales bacterium]